MELSPVVDEGEDTLGGKDISRVSEALVFHGRTVESLLQNSFVQSPTDQGSRGSALNVDPVQRCDGELVSPGKVESTLRRSPT